MHASFVDTAAVVSHQLIVRRRKFIIKTLQFKKEVANGLGLLLHEKQAFHFRYRGSNKCPYLLLTDIVKGLIHMPSYHLFSPWTSTDRVLIGALDHCDCCGRRYWRIVLAVSVQADAWYSTCFREGMQEEENINYIDEDHRVHYTRAKASNNFIAGQRKEKREKTDINISCLSATPMFSTSQLHLLFLATYA